MTSEVGETGRLHALIEKLIEKWRREALDPLAEYEPGDCSAFVWKSCADELSAALREAGQEPK